MKNASLLVFILLWFCNLYAQDYEIKFSGNGASSEVDSVTIENITQGNKITLSGSQSLHLKAFATGIKPIQDNSEFQLNLYPNPSTDYFTIEFGSQKMGLVAVRIFDVLGRELICSIQSLAIGFHSFRVSGLGSGIYMVKVDLEGNSYTKKLVSNNLSGTQLNINYLGSTKNFHKISKLKSITDVKYLQYNTGDRLKFIGKSGKYSTIVMDVPTANKTIDFSFVECTDADGNNYPVVHIGNQVWMAENLRTTKYNDGSIIPYVTDNLKWAGLSTDAYCWYNNSMENLATYGALYNWFAISSNKLAPKGWHVATNKDWLDLINYIGENTDAGGKLKESGYVHWENPNYGATNEYGFSALPGGVRIYNQQYSVLGVYGDLGKAGNWWASTEQDDSHARYTALGFDRMKINNSFAEKQNGYSVRSVLGTLPSVKTMPITNIKADSAMVGGQITNNGGLPLIKKGVCWSIQHNPTISDFKTADENSEEIFSCIITELNQNTTYYVRAFAINELGISYGNEESFLTPSSPILDFRSNNKTPFVGLDTVTVSWTIDSNTKAKLTSGDWSKEISGSGNYSFVPTEEKNYIFTIETQGLGAPVKKTITVTSSVKRDDYCGTQRVEFASIWTNPNQTFYQTNDNGKTWVEVVDEKAFPILFDKYVSVNALWSGVLSDFQKLCKKTYMIEPDKYNAYFNWDIQDSTTSGAPGITTGLIGPNGLGENGTTTDSLPMKVTDIDENFTIKFETTYDFPGCDVFLLDIWFYPEKESNNNRTKELMFTLNKLPDNCFESVPKDKISLAGYDWLTYGTTNFGRSEPNPMFPNDPNSFFWSKGFYLETPLSTYPINNSFELKLKPIINYLLQIGFLNETDWLGIISTGVEPKKGVGFLNLKNYQVKFK